MIKQLNNIYLNFKHYWFLMTQLISRDFKVKYKRSVLGVVWSLLYPILMLAVMAVVFSQMFRVRVEGANYLVYLMTGIIMFNYFNEASTNAMTSVVDNFGLINKVYIPKYIFPVAKCLFIGINFLLTLIPWFGIILLSYVGLGEYFIGINFLLTLIPWFGIILLSYVGLGEYTCHISINYLLLPYIFACLFLFTVGIGLFLSCVSVFLRY